MVDLQPRQSFTAELQNSSYNSIKLFPVKLYVQNAVNDNSVQVIDATGIIRSVPAKTNQVIDISKMLTVSLLNTGRAAVKLVFLDAAGASISDVSLTAGDQSTQSSINDFLFHFDDTTVNLFNNSGVESSFVVNNVSAAVSDTTNGKFGTGCASYPLNNDSSQIKDFGFFDLTKDFTCDFWLQPTASTAVGSVMYFSNATPAPAAATVQFGIRLASAVVPAGIGIFEGGVFTPSPGVEISGSTFDFVRCTNSGGAINLYVNGVLVVQTTLSSPSVYDYMYIGACSGATGFVGDIDEFRYSKGYIPSPEEAVLVPDAPYY